MENDQKVTVGIEIAFDLWCHDFQQFQGHCLIYMIYLFYNIQASKISASHKICLLKIREYAIILPQDQLDKFQVNKGIYQIKRFFFSVRRRCPGNILSFDDICKAKFRNTCITISLYGLIMAMVNTMIRFYFM